MKTIQNCALDHEIKFSKAQAISPIPFESWPGERNDNLYWVLKKDFELEKIHENFSVKIAADRNYEIYINSKKLAKQQNYFHGSKYIFAQKREYENPSISLRNGSNTIEILVRSDISGSKNYVPFHPFVVMEITDEKERILTATDDSWKTAIVQNWRCMIALATSTTHEKINLQPFNKSGIAGIPQKLDFFFPYILDKEKDLPKLYEWTDLPKKIKKLKPRKILSYGGCTINENALVFRLTEIFNSSKNATLKTVIHVSEKTLKPLAISAMCQCETYLNGKKIANRNSLPGRSLMRQYNYASPLCAIPLERGENILEFKFGDEHKRFFEWEEKYRNNFTIAGLYFKIILHKIDTQNLDWRADEKNVTSKQLPEKLWDKFSAKGTTNTNAEFSFNLESSKFSIANLETKQKNHVILDYSKTVRAYLSFRLKAETPGRIFIAYGILEEGNAVDCGRNGRKAVDILEVPAGDSFYQATENRVLVYLDMTFEGFSGNVNVSELEAQEELFLKDDKTLFKSSGNSMNRIWNAGVRTAQLCCDEIYMDNPERERGQWLDNFYPNSVAGYYAFGESRKVGKVLEEILLLQMSDGQLPGHTGAWGERIPLQGHLALYIHSVWRYFQYTGDLKLIKRLFPGILRIINFWLTFRNRNGLLENLETLFIDWGVHIYSYCSESANPPPVGVNTAMNAYCLRCLQIVSELAGYIGNTSKEKELKKDAESLKKSMRKHLFDENKKLFKDGMNNPLAEVNYSQAANVLAVYSGAVPVGMQKIVLRKAFIQSEPWIEIIPASAHFTTQTCESLFSNGLGEIAYNWIRKGYGSMLNDPAGTLWETWEPYVSHCQGTASGIIYLLSKYHVGLYPVEPGFEKIGIKPSHCGQNHLKTILRTPFGIVKTEWKYKDGIYNYNLELPESLKGRKVVADKSVRLIIR